eukprot:scaffold4574_cov143-Isochrysis_galbana.AAC.2
MGVGLGGWEERNHERTQPPTTDIIVKDAQTVEQAKNRAPAGPRSTHAVEKWEEEVIRRRFTGSPKTSGHIHA